jgi:ribosomal protein L23
MSKEKILYSLVETEKATLQQEQNKISLKVIGKVNKIEVKKYVEKKIEGNKVLKVNILNRKSRKNKTEKIAVLSLQNEVSSEIENLFSAAK